MQSQNFMKKNMVYKKFFFILFVYFNILFLNAVDIDENTSNYISKHIQLFLEYAPNLDISPIRVDMSNHADVIKALSFFQEQDTQNAFFDIPFNDQSEDAYKKSFDERLLSSLPVWLKNNIFNSVLTMISNTPSNICKQTLEEFINSDPAEQTLFLIRYNLEDDKKNDLFALKQAYYEALKFTLLIEKKETPFKEACIILRSLLSDEYQKYYAILKNIENKNQYFSLFSWCLNQHEDKLVYRSELEELRMPFRNNNALDRIKYLTFTVPWIVMKCCFRFCKFSPRIMLMYIKEVRDLFKKDSNFFPHSEEFNYLKEILSLPNDNELKKIDNKEDYLEESIFCKNTDVLYILEYFKPCLNQDEINVLENYARVSARFLGLRIELIKHSCKAIKDSIKKENGIVLMLSKMLFAL